MFLKTYNQIGVCGLILTVLMLVSLFYFIKNLFFLWLVNRDFFKDFESFERGEKNILKDEINITNPMLAIMVDVAKHHANHSKDIKSEVAYLFHKYFCRVTNGITVLRLVSVISPLLGLMGTMLGMVSMFRSISMVDANTNLLATGIWEALLTTIMGLTVAIPTLCFYYYLQLRIKNFRINAIEYSYRVIGLTCKKCPYGGKNE
ncbi:MAG: MotA/TolQ/ExbB proton channel family protein [Verrucomicrobiota bacterium]|nr:MotA/TolQ/ExbB proton channel family protein [Verrucomicrobiota bacterium]